MSRITASDIFDMFSRSEALQIARRIWSEGNDSGNGFDPDELIEGLEPEISGDGFDVYRIGDDAVIVADANGPWAVRI